MFKEPLNPEGGLWGKDRRGKWSQRRFKKSHLLRKRGKCPLSGKKRAWDIRRLVPGGRLERDREVSYSLANFRFRSGGDPHAFAEEHTAELPYKLSSNFSKELRFGKRSACS